MFVAIDPFELPESDAPAVVVGTAYPNGYRFRRALRVAGSAVPGGETGLVLRFEETLPSFKSVANGGNVTSSLGYDIVFTDQLSTQIPHELESYDPVTGTVGAWVAQPDSGGGIDVDLWVYYGKPGVATPQDDPAGVWAGMLGCWRGGDYRDVTTNARHMTAAGSVALGTILNQPAAVLSGAAGAAYFELATAAAVAVLAGRAAVTSALLIKPSSVPAANADVVRWGGTTPGTGWLGHTFFATGTVWRNYVRTDEPGTVFLVGPDAVQAGHVYLSAATWAAGTPAEQVIDGTDVAETRSVTPAGTAEPLTGTVTVPAGTLLRVGAGYGDNAGAFVPGSYGRYFLWPAKKSAAFLAFLDLAVRFPHAVYGIGDEDAVSDADRSPILSPATAAVAPGGTVSVNILAGADDPDGGTMLAGLAAPTAGLGTAAVSANAIKYVANATAGTDHVGITATQGTKTASALLTVSVTGKVVVGTGAMPVAPDATTFWQEVKRTDKAAAFTQDPLDLRLTGGAAGDGTQTLGIVSIKRPDAASPQGMFGAPYTLEFDYTPLDTNSVAGGVFSQLYLLRAVGGNANLGSLAAGYSPVDSVLGPVASGVRFSFDLKNPGTNGDQIRGRAVDPSFGASGASPANFGLASGESVATFAFPRNAATHLAWNFPGDDTASVTATWPAGSTPASTTQNFKDPLIQTWLGTGAKNFLITAYAGRDCKVANVVWTPGSVVIGVTGGGSEGLAPDFPDVAAHIAAGGFYKNVAAGSSLQAAYDALTPGQIAGGAMLLVDYGTQEVVTNGALTFDKSGTAAKPIIIRVGNWDIPDGGVFLEPGPDDSVHGKHFPDSAHVRDTVSFTQSCTVSGDHNWIRGFRFNGGVDVPGDGNRFNRCYFDGAAAGGGNLVVDTGDGNTWDWCEWANFVNVGLQHLPNKGAKNAVVYRCIFDGQTSNNGSSGTYHMLGTAPATSLSAVNTPRMSNIVVLDCWYSGTGTASKHQTATESWEAKVSGAQQIRCGTTGTFYYTDSKGIHNNDMKSNIRHGFENRVIACRMDRLIVRGRGNIVADCVMTGGNVDVVAGDETFTDWIAETPYDSAHPNYPTAEDTDVVRCDSAALRLGYMESGPHAGLKDLPPTGTTVWGSPPSTSGVVYMNGAKNPVATATGQPSRLVTTFTIPGGGTWTLRAAKDQALAASWDATKVGPNASYSASDDT